MTEEEMKAYSRKADDMWRALNLKATEDLSQAFYNTPGVSTMGSVLVAGIETVERIRRECPVEWPGDRLLGIKMHTSDLIPPGVAYMVAMPRYDSQFRPLQFAEDEQIKSRLFRPQMDYSVKLGVPRHIIHECWEVDVEPRVVWPEPEAPAQPLSGGQWLVIVGVLSWILCALSRAV